MRLPPLASRVYLWPLRALLLLLGSTLLLALSRMLWRAAFPPVTQRQRERKNQAAVLLLRGALAEGRGSLTPERANRIVRQTGACGEGPMVPDVQCFVCLCSLASFRRNKLLSSHFS